MKMFVEIVGFGLVAAAGWMVWPEEQAPQAMDKVAAVTRAQAHALAAPIFAIQPPVPATEIKGEPKRTFVPYPAIDTTASAWQSMALASREGDNRTPPLAIMQSARLPPSAAQLADPESYHKYETDQNARVLAAYGSVAAAELPKLHALVARVRAEGFSAEQIAEAEDKLHHFEQLVPPR